MKKHEGDTFAILAGCLNMGPQLVVYGLSLWAVWEWASGWAFWGPVIAAPILVLGTLMILGAAAEGKHLIGPEADSAVFALGWVGIGLWTLYSACTSCPAWNQ